MRLVFLIRSLAVGGAERQLSLLSRELVRRGHQVTVLLCYGGGAFETELEAAGVRIIDLKKRGRWRNALFFVRLVRAVRSERPDVIHGYMTTSNLFALLLGRVGCDAAIAWGVRASDLRAGRLDWAVRLFLRLERKLVRYVDVVIVNSQTGAREFCGGETHANVTVIENGIESAAFGYDASARRRVRESWGVAMDTPLVGCVARLDPMKDHVTLLRGFALVHQKHPKTRLICVGSKVEPYASHLRTVVRELHLDGAVHWAAGTSRLSELYSAFDVFCSSSAYGEGFSNVLGEAMLCGVPCVATDVGDAARILSSADFLVPSRNPAALARALEQALAQGRAFSEPRAEKIRREFSAQSLADRTERALTGAVERKSGRIGNRATT